MSIVDIGCIAEYEYGSALEACNPWETAATNAASEFDLVKAGCWKVLLLLKLDTTASESVMYPLDPEFLGTTGSEFVLIPDQFCAVDAEEFEYALTGEG
jgi:hypothetical protein